MARIPLEDNFDDVIKSQNLAMDLSVPSKLDEAAPDEKISVNLKFTRLKDFVLLRISRWFNAN